MFIIVLKYKQPLDNVDKTLPAHVEYLKKQYELGNFVASGRQVPRKGGVILSRLQTREELDLVLSQDPFHIQGIADYEVIEFIPTMASPEFAFLL